jgi:hypothetical protein
MGSDGFCLRWMMATVGAGGSILGALAMVSLLITKFGILGGAYDNYVSTSCLVVDAVTDFFSYRRRGKERGGWNAVWTVQYSCPMYVGSSGEELRTANTSSPDGLFETAAEAAAQLWEHPVGSRLDCFCLPGSDDPDPSDIPWAASGVLRQTKPTFFFPTSVSSWLAPVALVSGLVLIIAGCCAFPYLAHIVKWFTGTGTRTAHKRSQRSDYFTSSTTTDYAL